MQFVYANHTLDIDRRELRRGSDAIAVEPQVFDLLVYLVEIRVRLGWPDRLRLNSDEPYQRRAKGVGDIGDEQKLIRTIASDQVDAVGLIRQMLDRMVAGRMPDPRDA